jgi:general secretion pathway protein G
MIQRNLKRRPAHRAGFTLMEMLVVVAIIVALASLGLYYFMGSLKESQEGLAKTHVRTTLTQACQSYYLKHNMWPPSLEALTHRSELGFGPYLEDLDSLKDPWGKLYQYDQAGTQNDGLKPDIWTVNPDNQKVIGNWSELKRQ